MRERLPIWLVRYSQSVFVLGIHVIISHFLKSVPNLEQVALTIGSSVLISQYFAGISLLLRDLPAFNTRASFNKVMVGTAVRDKLLMGALFCNTSISKEENLVSFLNC